MAQCEKYEVIPHGGTSMEAERVRMKGRLKEQPAPAVLKYIFEPRLKTDMELLPYLTQVNLAHVVMLSRESIISKQEATALLDVLMAIDTRGSDLLEPDAELEGLYLNYERHVIERLGPRVGGKLHIGRSRNDLGATMSRMRVRDLVLDLLDRTIGFRLSLLDRAEQEVETIITGYTHLQPAQPITLGHYLVAIEQAVSRDGDRLFHTFQTVNKSCLGAGALAGTGFPINRQLTSDLLGFDGLIENTLDAVASRDFLLELFSNLAIIAVTLSRLAQDIFVWCSYEFGIIDIPDRLAGTSSMMPQKKNPIVLESSKGRLAHVFGGLISALSAMKNTNYSNVVDVNYESFHLLKDSCYQTEAALALLGELLEAMEIQKERTVSMASANFSTVTQLADTLVVRGDYSFREAHHIIATVARVAAEREMTAAQITTEFIDTVAAEEIGRKVGLGEDEVRRALAPAINVQSRSHRGGPAPEAVARAIKRALERVEEDGRLLESIRRGLQRARASLRSVVREELEQS
jgi:argininosuccinate lyase